MINIAFSLARGIVTTSKKLGLGAGSTWPGHILLSLEPNFLKYFDNKFKGKIIVVVGTNGKTTTSKMIREIVEKDKRKVIHNDSGANLLNGITSAIVHKPHWESFAENDVAIFETDENNMPLLLKELNPDVLVVLNIFRDQLDRYGEVEAVASKWKKSIEILSRETVVILNANDPYVAFLGKDIKAQTVYFGLDNSKLFSKTKPFAMDASYCPNCNHRLVFDGFYFAHLGNWKCAHCGFKMPEIRKVTVRSSLPGMYNDYNTMAASIASEVLGIQNETIKRVLEQFDAAFGRQEELTFNDKKVKIFLSKNPAGFTESIRTSLQLGGTHFLLLLNDRIPDGRDVSWVWDVDFEQLKDAKSITVSGDRVYDMAVRIKYTDYAAEKMIVKENLLNALESATNNCDKNETLYVLATYSAMLEVRKLIKGRKIL